MTALDLLRGARALLVERGWCQGAFEAADGSGKCCSIGALNLKASGNPRCHPGNDADGVAYFAAREALAAAVTGNPVTVIRGSCFEVITKFNDYAALGVDDVLAKFDAAIAALEASS